MFKMIYLIICLIILSYKDIKDRVIPVIWLILMGAVIPVVYICDYAICREIINYKQIIIAVIFVIVFMVTAVFTSMIGEADGIVMGYVCLLTDVYAAMTAIFISFVMLAVTGGILMLFKRIKLKTSMPYIPFLLVSCMIAILL